MAAEQCMKSCRDESSASGNVHIDQQNGGKCDLFTVTQKSYKLGQKSGFVVSSLKQKCKSSFSHSSFTSNLVMSF